MSETIDLLIYNGEYQTKIIENGKVLNSLIMKDLIVSKEYEVTIKIRMNLFFDKQFGLYVNGLIMDSPDYQVFYDKSYFEFETNYPSSIVEMLHKAQLATDLQPTARPKEILNKIGTVESQQRKELEKKLQEAMNEFKGKSKEEKVTTIRTVGKEYLAANKQTVLVPIQEKIIQTYKEFITKVDEKKEDVNEDYLTRIYERLLETMNKQELSKRLVWLDPAEEATFTFRFKVFKPSSFIPIKLTFNYYSTIETDRSEFNQTELNVLCYSSCNIDSTFVDRTNTEDIENHLIQMKEIKPEKYQYCLFDEKMTSLYQQKVIDPFFLNEATKRYFVDYYGRSDFGKEKKSYFMFGQAKSLFDYLSVYDSKFQLIDVISIALEVCKAVKLLHENKLVHNHLNDETIMIERINKRYKIKLWTLTHIYANDTNQPLFGFATVPSNDATVKKIVFDKNKYTYFSSPEMKQKQQIDYLSDTYSIGILLLLLLQFNGSKSLAEFRKLIEDLQITADSKKLQFIEDKKFRCPKAMNELIAKCVSGKATRCSLYGQPDSVIPTLEKLKLQFLI